MADMNKAEKLAAARRRLKEFQQKSKETTVVGAKTTSKKHPPNSSTNTERKNDNEQSFVFDSGTTYSLANEAECGTIVSTSSTQSDLSDSLLNGDNHFIKEEINDNILEPSTVQESCSLNNHFAENFPFQITSNIIPETAVLQPQPSAINESLIPVANMFSNTFQSSNINAKDFFDNIPIQNSYMTENNPPSLLAENENKINLTVQYTSDNINPETDSVPCETTLIGADNLSSVETFHSPDPIIKQESQVITADDTDKNKCLISFETSLPNISDNLDVNNQDVNVMPLPEKNLKKSSRSSTESLRQLSLQINGLIDESVEIPNSHINELEHRNQELAAVLTTERLKTAQLQLQLKEYQSRVSQLQVDNSQLQAESETRLARELHPLQEQLQLHVQTVGILVGEKTELQAALTKSQQTAKQKAAEVEELQGRLKASRHRVNELEKELSTISTVSKQFETSNQEQLKEVDSLKLENKMVKKQLEETEEESLEFRQKLNSKVNEYVALQQELHEKQSQLDLSQLRVQQLSTSDSPDLDSQLEALHQQKVGLEHQVVELQQTVKSLGSERDQANQQYQEYLQQFNTQLKNLADKLATTSSENEQLSNREQSLVHHISELEKRLQHVNNSRDSPTRLQEAEKLEALERQLNAMEGEKRDLAEELNTWLQESKNLQIELDERTKSMAELETMVEALQSDQPDANRLLAAMESDKVAAAQAVGQNHKLKQQLEELQDGFIQMSNTKLELTEHLQHEQHISKEQGERLAQQEGEMNDLRNQLEEKEKQIQELRQNSSELSNQMLQHSQIADRMRHYEAQGQLTELLHKELEQAKAHIQALSLQNNELRTQLAHQSTQEFSNVVGDNVESNDRKDEMLATLSSSVRQLELERDQLLAQLQDIQQSKEPATLQQTYSGPDIPKLNSTTKDMDTKEYTSMKEAMDKLQQRFTKTMEEIAELSDEKQRLEHLVLQLQGETETIGEYIALYQVQRSILRQRTQEKDEQLARLAQDREDMRTKLNELNNLIRRLVTEKGSDFQQSQQQMITDMEIVNEHNIKVEESLKPESEGLLNGDVESASAASDVTESSLPPTTSVDQSNPVVFQADTAGKIMALLSEIGSSSLVEPQISQNFHPCPWCSGRLITV